MMTLFKYYPYGGYCPALDKLEDFINDHIRNCSESGFDLNGNRVFDIIPENGTPMEYKDGKVELL